MSAARVKVIQRTKRYAEVYIDLWPCNYDLNRAGVDRWRGLLDLAARRSASYKRPVYFSANKTLAWISRVRREEADLLAQSLAEIASRDEYQLPIRIIEVSRPLTPREARA